MHTEVDCCKINFLVHLLVVHKNYGHLELYDNFKIRM